MYNKNQKQIKIAMITGVLGKGGAEKQLFYIISAMKRLNFNVRVFTLTNGEYYERKLLNIGIDCHWIGKSSSPIWRLIILLKEIIRFRPHIIYSTHFYGNLYSGLLGRILGILSVGSIRNDLTSEIKKNGIWSRWLIRCPHVLIANSYQALNHLKLVGVKSKENYVLQNFIDLTEFDQLAKEDWDLQGKNDRIKIILVARLVNQKRIDRFIEIISSLSKNHSNIIGLIVGDGPEKDRLHQKAIELNLFATQLFFLGQVENIPALLKKCDLLVLTSDHEGFPNVILEGMAANLPIIATDVGDIKRIIKEGSTGFVIGKDYLDGFVEKIEKLISSKNLRNTMGAEGRKSIEQTYDIRKIDEIFMDILIRISKKNKKRELLNLLENMSSND